MTEQASGELMMQQLVQQMTENIEHTTRLYEEILASEREKQRAIIAGDIEALTEIIPREEELMGLASQLEAERTELRGQFAEADDRLGPDSRLEHIIAILDGPWRDVLAEKRQGLLALAGQISEVNRVNFQLLRGSTDLLRGTFRDVAGAPPPPATCDSPGRQSNPDCDAMRSTRPSEELGTWSTP